MAQLFVGLILLVVLSHWDKPDKKGRMNKKKRPDYVVFQAKESLRNMFK